MTVREWYWLPLNNEEPLLFLRPPSLCTTQRRVERGGGPRKSSEGGMEEGCSNHYARLIQFFLPSADWRKTVTPAILAKMKTRNMITLWRAHTHTLFLSASLYRFVLVQFFFPATFSRMVYALPHPN
ncbi:hypothetical protein CDAR_184981 [Caerostris darwini]|uniref:Uncharacterized protein n=1 Tax=Caerostris darwini TaxID=1538125 RepID=A0AAV4SNT7_9ARAC|nr:hypothetical protein CDAR_184981 [Caerostris darwini]